MYSTHFRYVIFLYCALVIILGLTSCQNKLYKHASIDCAEDAANVYVSAYPAIPWTDIADKLEPKNNLTTEQARAMAVQTTQVEISQFLSTFAAGLGLGLPLKTGTSTTTIADTGIESTTGTKTKSWGNVPSSPTPQWTITDSTTTAPDLSKGPASGVDASALLTVGTALYQQAQILDNQISNPSRSYYTCGHDHDRRNPEWKPFRLLTQYCRKQGLDDYEAKELIEDRVGRRLVCECELVGGTA